MNKRNTIWDIVLKTLKNKIVGLLGVILAATSSGLLVASKLEIFSRELPGCGAESSCSSITQAPWGTIPFTYLPVSFVGLGYFMGLLTCWFLCGWCKLGLFIRLGGLVSVYYVGVMLYLGKLCPYCMMSHLGNFLLIANYELRKNGFTKIKNIWSKQTIILFFVFIATVFSSWIRFVDVSQRQKEETEQSIQKIITSKKIKDFVGRYVLGPEDAPISVVMISDYQCPDCLRFEKEIMNVLKSRTDTSLSVKHFPFSTECNEYAPKNLHPNSCWAARAAETAGILYGNDGFWKMHKWLFEVEGEFTNETFSPALQSLGFNPNSFIKTMSQDVDGVIEKRIQSDISESISLGLYYTPMIFVNGVQLRWYGGTGEKDLTRAINKLGNAIALGNSVSKKEPESNVENMASDWEVSPKLSFKKINEAHILGNENAKNSISIWCDAQFPKSKDILRVCKKAIKKHPNTNIRWHQFPLNTTCNSDSVTNSLSLEGSCLVSIALEAGSLLYGETFFFNMLEKIKPTWRGERGATQSDLVETAVSLGADQVSFIEAMKDPNLVSRVEAQKNHKSNVQKVFNSRSVVRKPFYLMVAVNEQIVERWISPTKNEEDVIVEILKRLDE